MTPIKTGKSLALTASVLTLAACAHGTPPPEISLDEPPTPRPALVDPPKPVEIVQVPTPLPLPGQLKPSPGRGGSAPEPGDPQARVALANRAARVQPSRYGYLNATQVWPYCGRRALPSLRLAREGDRRRLAGRRAARLRVGRRHRALGDRRHLVGHGRERPRPHPRQADPAGPEDQPRGQHRPPDLPARADRDRADLDGVRLLGLPAGPATRASEPEPPRRGGRARRRTASCSNGCTSATPSRATTRPGGRCGRSTTARRSTSSSRPASPRASCRRCSWSGRPARTSSSTTARARPTTWSIACSARPSCGSAATPAGGADRAHRRAPARDLRLMTAVPPPAAPQVPPQTKVAPEALALRAKPRPVTRLSRRALILLGSVSALTIGGLAIWALGVNHGGGTPPQELYSTDRKPSRRRAEHPAAGLCGDAASPPACRSSGRRCPATSAGPSCARSRRAALP